MKRPFLVLAGVLLFSSSIFAEEARTDKSRYQIVPNKEGFVRLDTATGGLTHCRDEDGIWRCESVIDEPAEFDRGLLALKEDVDLLGAALKTLDSRLTAIEKGLEAVAPAPPLAEAPRPETPGLNEQEMELDQALSLAERMMQRFFEMIRELKTAQSTQHI